MRTPSAWLAICVIGFTCSATPAVFSQTSFVTLGEAANYAVLGRNLNLHNVAVYGDAGVGADGSISVTSTSELYGDLYMGLGASSSIGGVFTGVSYQPHDVDAALADSVAAAQEAAALTPNYIISSVTGPLTLDPTGPQTVVNITGNLNLSGGDSLYFTGGSSHRFILNVFGSLAMGGSSVIGGAEGNDVGAEHILVNVVGTGTKITTQINNTIHGTILAPERQFEMHSVNGAVIGGSLEMKLMSDSILYNVPFVPVPEPGSLPLIGLAAMALVIRRVR